ncbi:MAG: outer membrane beta-barrel protein [Sphingomicrobium sp.]
MRALLLGATCLIAVVAAPAAARDHSAYYGLEVGVLKVKDNVVRIDGVDTFRIDHMTGIDGDMILGYDFGMFRTEAELAYRRSGHNEYDFATTSVDGDGRTSTHSAMVNAMVDVGNESQVAFFAGAGVGYAQIIQVVDVGAADFKIKDRGLAWQVVAGARKALTNFFDVGVKYRYFNGGNVSDVVAGDRVSTKYRSHSLLASLIYNFNTPEPAAPLILPPPVAPPPPPPPPPATQTCPDGSVVLATDPCPMPPPPPPPPEPVPERG